MAVKESIVNDIAVVEVKGKLMGGKETEECHDKVKSLLDRGYKKLIIDLSHVKWVNSKGLGMLMAGYTSCRNASGDLKIAGAQEKVNSLLMMTKLITIFESFDNTDQAIGSYR